MVGTHYCLNLCGQAKYKVELGSDPLGNLTRIENELAKLPHGWKPQDQTGRNHRTA